MAADDLGTAAVGWHSILVASPLVALLGALWGLRELPRYFRGVKRDWRDEDALDEKRLDVKRDKILDRLDVENARLRRQLAEVQESEWRGWSKARWAKNELHERTHLLRNLMQMIDAAGLPHNPWPDLSLPTLDLAPELPPDGIAPGR